MLFIDVRIASNIRVANHPHFRYVEEIDVTKLEAMREDGNANRGGRPKFTMLPLLTIAVCKAVAQFPMMNACQDDEAVKRTMNQSGNCENN